MAASVGAARHVAVIGGGWAGLAAAIEATLRGHTVSLFEMSGQWGGRARTVDFVNELPLDNGQHILIGAYVETLRLMRLVGVDMDTAFVRRPLEVVDPEGHGLALRAGPPITAFAAAVMRQANWSWRERLALLTTATEWAVRRFACPPQQTVAELTHRLPARIRDEFIDPLCIAALNTPAAHASGAVFLRVIRDALFAGPGSADLLLPRARLGDLLPVPAVAWLAQRGARLMPSHRVAALTLEGQRWRVEHAVFDRVILATTPVEGARLALPHAPDWSAITSALRYEPIVTVYARSEGTRLSKPMLMLPSDERRNPAQFVFDHGWLGGSEGLLAFVVSGAAPWIARGVNATRDAVLDQAQHQLRAQLAAPLEVIRVLTEKRATFRCTPGLRRAPMRIAPGLLAAGDHVDGPYPATLEGAVRAGINAARAIE